MSLIIALFVVSLALTLGLIVGRRRGAIAGIAVGLGVFMAGCIGYVGLLTLILPM